MNPVKLLPDNSHDLINIDDLDQPIYRVMDVEHLFAIFEHSKICFVSPFLWDDPFERFLDTCFGKDRFWGVNWSYKGYAKCGIGVKEVYQN